jgi:ubiquinone/menaquinone biosynthesis C-methylase UbiE
VGSETASAVVAPSKLIGIEVMGNTHNTAYSDQQAATYDEERFATPAGRRIHRREAEQLRRALNKLPAGSLVLEFGCGTGRLLAIPSEYDQQTIGVDASLPMLRRARHKLSHAGIRSTLILADARAVPLKDGHCDAVYGIRLLNQTGSPENALQALSEMVRLTRPGGLILVEFPNKVRPRLGEGRSGSVRLRPNLVSRYVSGQNVRTISWEGAFFVGMQTYHACPRPLLGLLDAADRLLSTAFPRLCGRCYLYLEKE